MADTVVKSNVIISPVVWSTMKNILIVDDNRDLADGLAMLLEDDFSVTTSYGGIDALNFLAANDYDLILLDVELPDINGIEVYCQIKGQKPDAVILMMTGYRIEQLLNMVAGSHEARILRRSSGLGEYMGALRNAGKFAITLIVDDLDASTSVEEPVTIDSRADVFTSLTGVISTVHFVWLGTIMS